MTFKTLMIIWTLGFVASSDVFAIDSSDRFEHWYYKKTKKYSGWKSIVIHHSATSAGSVQGFDKFHKDQGYGGIAYHFVIGNGRGIPDGKIIPTFRWKKQMSGTHASVNSWDHNIFGIGICLVGNFEKTQPTPKQKAALIKLVARLQKKYRIPAESVVGHRAVRYDHDANKSEQTLCPGKNLKASQYASSLSAKDWSSTPARAVGPGVPPGISRPRSIVGPVPPAP